MFVETDHTYSPDCSAGVETGTISLHGGLTLTGCTGGPRGWAGAVEAFSDGLIGATPPVMTI